MRGAGWAVAIVPKLSKESQDTLDCAEFRPELKKLQLRASQSAGA